MAVLGLFVAAQVLSLVMACGSYSFVAVFWLLIAVACLKAQALGHVGSVAVAHRLSCPSRNPPGPVIQQVSPALRVRFLTTQPSGNWQLFSHITAIHAFISWISIFFFFLRFI